MSIFNYFEINKKKIMRKFLTISVFLICLIISVSFSQTVVKNVLLEEFSTAPCGFCPEGGLIAEELIDKYPNLITYTHHAGFGTDSMTIPESRTIAGIYTTFAPAAVIDRGDYKIPVYTYPDFIGISRQKWDSIVSERLNEPAEAEVLLTQNFNSITRFLNAKIDVKFLVQVDTNDFRFNLAIIEDSVSGIGEGWDQKNYFNDNPNYPSLYQKGNPIVGFVHRHVIRAMPTGTWGYGGIIPDYPETDLTYTYNLNDFKIPDNWKEKDINLVAFVSYYNTDKFKHKILNSVQSKLSVTTGIENDVISGIDEMIMSINPNPVNDISSIEFYQQKDNHVSIKIIDRLGIEAISVLNNKILNTGFHKLNFDSKQLNPGIYFCVLNTGDSYLTQKFVVVK